jgi:hypothetical protein
MGILTRYVDRARTTPCPHARVVDEYAGGVTAGKTFNGRAGTWDVTISGTAVEQGVNADCDAVTWTWLA